MRLLVSWLRDFVDVKAPAEEIGERLGLRGFELAAIELLGDGDAVIDFEITANRPDCLSVIGLAREVATLYDVPVKEVHLQPAPSRPTGRAVEGSDLKITIEDPELCPRYAALVAEATIGRSPDWLIYRLNAAGVRSISSIVDITNYVLIELGHPTHAFDLEKLAGREIRVRRAAAGERLTTLDGVERALDPDMLVIADRDRAQAVAGVMGGALAEVSPATTLVAFESAYFKPSSVRRTSKRLGLKTEASSRFERGADVNAPIVALARIAALMDQINAGRVIAPAVDVYPGKRDPIRVHMRRARLAALLGLPVPDEEVERILRRLGLTVMAASGGWEAIVPTFRVDLVREVDLIEEVGRHYGFDKLPSTFPVMTAPAPPPDPRIPRDELVRRVLTAAGLSEAVTFGFIEARAAEPFLPEGAERPVAVANPLSAKFDTLRPSLLPGLVDAVAHNRRHGRDDVGLFEIGTKFSLEGETRSVAIAWTGSATSAHWSASPREVDFFDAKGIVEQLCRALAVPVRFAPGREAFLVPGQTASVKGDLGRSVGIVGQISPSVADARGLPRQDRLFAAELNLDLLWQVRAPVSEETRPLPRHPFVVRDLSIVVSDALPAEIIRGTIQTAGGTTPAPLTGVTFFDRYQGKGIPEGSVSLSLRMTFQALDRTLTDADVQASVDLIVAALIRVHGAVQR
jgi:phenylalanyl-tRNA synthetase beta chain